VSDNTLTLNSVCSNAPRWLEEGWVVVILVAWSLLVSSTLQDRERVLCYQIYWPRRVRVSYHFFGRENCFQWKKISLRMRVEFYDFRLPPVLALQTRDRRTKPLVTRYEFCFYCSLVFLSFLTVDTYNLLICLSIVKITELRGRKANNYCADLWTGAPFFTESHSFQYATSFSCLHSYHLPFLCISLCAMCFLQIELLLTIWTFLRVESIRIESYMIGCAYSTFYADFEIIIYKLLLDIKIIFL
jgi:hypothetical protein